MTNRERPMRNPVFPVAGLICFVLGALGTVPPHAAAATTPRAAAPTPPAAMPPAATPPARTAGPLAGLTADQIVAKASADLRAASSVHMYLSASGHGTKVVFSATLTRHGCETWFSMGGGFSALVLRIGSREWMKPSDTYWKELGYSGAQLTSMEGKWLTSPESDLRCDPAALASFPRTGWTVDRVDRVDRVEKVDRVDKHGTLVLELSHAGQLRMEVTDSARPEILRLTDAGDNTYLGDYNRPVRLTPPPSSEVITNLPPPVAGSLVLSIPSE
jgi:hypothetical protein